MVLPVTKKRLWSGGAAIAAATCLVGMTTAGAAMSSPLASATGSTLQVGCTSTYDNTRIDVTAKYGDPDPVTWSSIEVYTPAPPNSERGGTLTVTASLPKVSFVEPPGSKWVVYFLVVSGGKLVVVKSVNYTNTCKVLPATH